MSKSVTLFKCPKCGLDFHYFFFWFGVHVCGLTVSQDCLNQMRLLLLDFQSGINEILLNEFMNLGILKNRRIAYEQRIERKRERIGIIDYGTGG